MFIMRTAMFLIIIVLPVGLGAPVVFNVTTPADESKTNDNRDTTTLPALLGTICTVIVTVVAVFTLYMKCRQQDGTIGACCSKLHDVVLCVPCRRNKEHLTDFHKVCARIDDANSERSDTIRIVLIGKSGSGKSETANTIIKHENTFKTSNLPGSVTQICESARSTLFGQKILITDTPGIFDPKAQLVDTQTEIANFIEETLPGPHVLLFVLKVGRLTQEDVESLNKFKEQFGGAVENHLVVVFTHSKLLKNITEEKFVQSATEFIPMLRTYKGRYVFLENDSNTENKKSQLKQLLSVVQMVINENKGSCYSNEMYQTRLIEIEKERKQLEEDKKEKKRKKMEARKKEERQELNDLFDKTLGQLMQEIRDKNKAIYTRSLKPLLHALVLKIDGAVVCGVEIGNKTKDCLSNPVIKLANYGGGKIFLEPTLGEIDEDNFCMMVACKKDYTPFGTKGLITWDIKGKNYKAAIMWSVPYGPEANRLAVGFSCDNDAKTQNDMYSNARGDKYCRREFKKDGSRSYVEMRYDNFIISGIMTSERRTTVEVELMYHN